jgi:Protein of unknown function (DUF2550)
MRVVEALGIAALLVLCGLILIYARREIISRRGGTIEMYMRLSTYMAGRGWAPGVGRFTPDQLRWYRVFSFGLRPRRVLTRHGLVVEDRRRPEGAERQAMPEGWVIVRCRPVADTGSTGAGTGAAGPAIELAVAETALSGFLSWLESAPPRALRLR